METLIAILVVSIQILEFLPVRHLQMMYTHPVEKQAAAGECLHMKRFTRPAPQGPTLAGPALTGTDAMITDATAAGNKAQMTDIIIA